MTATLVPVAVPDIGDFDSVPVIEILVSVGDVVALEEPLVTLESDKATMDVPSPVAGTVTEINVALGDHVSQGSMLLSVAPATGDEESALPAPSVSSAAPPDAASVRPEPEPEPEPALAPNRGRSRSRSPSAPHRRARTGRPAVRSTRARPCAGSLANSASPSPERPAPAARGGSCRLTCVRSRPDPPQPPRPRARPGSRCSHGPRSTSRSTDRSNGYPAAASNGSRRRSSPATGR